MCLVAKHDEGYQKIHLISFPTVIKRFFFQILSFVERTVILVPEKKKKKIV